MIDPATLQVLAASLRGVAEEMGAALVRSAHSANIKERRDCSTGLFDAGGEMVMQAEHIPVHLGAMPAAVAAVLGEDQAELGATYELRYRGQAFELAVSASTEPEPQQLREAFEAQHEDRYGYSDSEQTLELVTIRVTATIPGADVTLAPSGDDAEVDRRAREATIGGRQVELEVLRGAPAPGTKIRGPAAIDLPESTLIVPAEWSGEVDDTGTIHLHRT